MLHRRFAPAFQAAMRDTAYVLRLLQTDLQWRQGRQNV